LRDSNEKAVYEMMEALRIPIVNAGNGLDEHPTQALADAYALLKWQPGLAKDDPDCSLRIGLIGVPKHMRTVRSLLYLLANFARGISEVVVITDEQSPFAEDQREFLEKSGLRIRVSKCLDDELPHLDAIYINAITWTGDGYEETSSRYRLSVESPLKRGAVILHPLARGAELDRDLDSTPHNWYFAQARGAVFIRMALLAAILKSFF
jgi:aspartate carbamoyltransferase catalytic subunit